ncbi:hypothetical protein UFOVP1292_11 [uncultured Caudovirales phage]|uniref:Uncharacterized protein n=1 Tax=uncultured Caudovirales phage TaxID=2100421 RepID=A0A6J5S7W8_9CAUD|nr:hypothetical protein UFOVP859_1 [uncultured Caudovirales phage]CAB4168557.1 hypothetical protein UFOVP882_83 [uncultured Caudovirales phage]CAB4196407.1 hypothetical protein UFOVP1292_11 [uncultured Caudovirales phage]CAB4204961.1 hypothetical protein UFOVP1411_2 [uncultured Caudovirales phage]
MSVEWMLIETVPEGSRTLLYGPHTGITTGYSERDGEEYIASFSDETGEQYLGVTY